MNNIKGLLAVLLLISAISAIPHPGVGIVIDSKGNVFYTDLKHIWKIDVQGKRNVAVPNVHSHEIYLDENDNLFGEHLWYEGEGSDKWGHYVWKRSPQGKVEKVVPPTEGFLKNYSFVRDHHNHMFWADRDNACQKIARSNPDGTSSKLGDKCLDDIQWMTATPAGKVYFVDHHDLMKMDEKGHIETIASGLGERTISQVTVNDPNLVMGVWTDKKENVYVAIYGARKVKKITPDKRVSVVHETSVWWSPTGGLVAPNGDFWLLEYSQTNEARVERITAAGERTIFGSGEK